MFWFSRKKTTEPVPAQPKPRASFWSTHEYDGSAPKKTLESVVGEIRARLPKKTNDAGVAMDDGQGGQSSIKMYGGLYQPNISEAVVMWYANQTFIGHQLCAILAQHWLINKACTMPARDAIRQGYDILSFDGEGLDPKALKIFKRYDKEFKINSHMAQFIRKGRIFGLRIAFFKVESTDPDYYEKPFNLDGVTPDSYKGIVQVDPYWTAPILDSNASAAPDTLHFYEPTHWIINGKQYHRSHLIIFRHDEPPDFLKPQYLYGGVPLVQQIMERIYAAERTANEAPQLAQSKRTTVFGTDMTAFMANADAAMTRLAEWCRFRDNYGVKVYDKEADALAQFDTSLSDFDSIIMTQYQLVSAQSGVPSTKLIGTTPKGFNTTGEYEKASYREMLESIQTHELTPFIERHHALVMRSFVKPKLGIDIETEVSWKPLDSPTASEYADINLKRAQTGQALAASGAIDGADERARLKADPDSGYTVLDGESPEVDDGETDPGNEDQTAPD